MKHGTPQAYIAKRSASCLHDVRGFIQRGGCPRPVGPKGDQGSTAHRGTHARAVESGGWSHCAMRPVHVQVCVGLPVVALELTLASFTLASFTVWSRMARYLYGVVYVDCRVAPLAPRPCARGGAGPRAHSDKTPSKPRTLPILGLLDPRTATDTGARAPSFRVHPSAWTCMDPSRSKMAGTKVQRFLKARRKRLAQNHHR